VLCEVAQYGPDRGGLVDARHDPHRGRQLRTQVGLRARVPWKRVRRAHGGGTSKTILAMKSTETGPGALPAEQTNLTLFLQAAYGRCEELAGEFMSGRLDGLWAAPVDFAGMNA
jgi:hypothetical protein